MTQNGKDESRTESIVCSLIVLLSPWVSCVSKGIYSLFLFGKTALSVISNIVSAVTLSEREVIRYHTKEK